MIKSFRIYVNILLFLITFISVNSLLEAQDFNSEDYVIFLPKGIASYIPRPVIIGFSPSGNGKDVVNIWQEAAEENNAVIIASNKVRNGLDIQTVLQVIKKDLNEKFSKEYPIDLKKVIAVGSSGGGGTTDYNYKLMKEDLAFLQKHGWTCKWIEFIGGHVMAPKEQRKEALKFVLDELEKKEKESNQK